MGTVTNEEALREHVRTEGGDTAVYIARVTCTNCGYMGAVKILGVGLYALRASPLRGLANPDVLFFLDPRDLAQTDD